MKQLDMNELSAKISEVTLDPSVIYRKEVIIADKKSILRYQVLNETEPGSQTIFGVPVPIFAQQQTPTGDGRMIVQNVPIGETVYLFCAQNIEDAFVKITEKKEEVDEKIQKAFAEMEKSSSKIIHANRFNGRLK